MPIIHDKTREDFLKYEYGETKDLCKQFLTVVTTVLALSLTFSEKILEFKNAIFEAKLLLISAWISMLFSIILCGIGIVVISIAGGEAAYNGNNYSALAQKAFKFIIAAGFLFVIGLTLLIFSAALVVLIGKESATGN